MPSIFGRHLFSCRRRYPWLRWCSIAAEEEVTSLCIAEASKTSKLRYHWGWCIFCCLIHSLLSGLDPSRWTIKFCPTTKTSPLEDDLHGTRLHHRSFAPTSEKIVLGLPRMKSNKNLELSVIEKCHVWQSNCIVVKKPSLNVTSWLVVVVVCRCVSFRRWWFCRWRKNACVLFFLFSHSYIWCTVRDRFRVAVFCIGVTKNRLIIRTTCIHDDLA